jgi:hypothetical protein
MRISLKLNTVKLLVGLEVEGGYWIQYVRTGTDESQSCGILACTFFVSVLCASQKEGSEIGMNSSGSLGIGTWDLTSS